MENLIKKNVGLIKILSVVLFVALMAFNVVITQNTHGNTSVDLSLSGLKAMALGSGEVDAGCQTDADCYGTDVCSDNGFCIADTDELRLDVEDCPGSPTSFAQSGTCVSGGSGCTWEDEFFCP